jgi:type I restriction enzyme S subunit
LHQRKLTHLQAQKKGLLQKMFPKEGERFPELRFPGFAEAWEVRKLGEVAEFSKGSGYSKDDLIDTGIPIILYGRLYTQYQTQIEEVNTFVKEKKYSVYSTGKEVIVPASGETAEDISIASAVIKSGILLGGDLNIIYPSSKLDSSFLALQISNGNAKKKLSRRAQGKSVVHLHNVDLQKVGIIFPSIHEQKEISEFLTNFDNLITLHQRKLTHLRQQKKALLQQMFV